MFETEEYGISSFVYEARKPFYPQKFYDFLHSKDLSGKLIDQKVFLACYSSYVCRKLESGWWNSSSWLCWFILEGNSKDRWPEDQESINFIKEKWVEPFGDMRQELVFIGQGLDQKKLLNY